MGSTYIHTMPHVYQVSKDTLQWQMHRHYPASEDDTETFEDTDTVGYVMVDEYVDVDTMIFKIDESTGNSLAYDLDPVKVEEKRDVQIQVIRQERTDRLAHCDWTQLPDVTLSQDSVLEWQAYRQALRDLPSNLVDPYNVTWPNPPV